MQRLANVYRGPHIESFHSGSIAVVDSRGRLLASAGDPAFVTCLRSAAKPFQAIPLIEYGGIEEFDLSAEEIALTCGSHGGEAFHVATAAAMLRKGEFDESDLLCGAHVPFDEKAAADLKASGEVPSALHNNCSGKHAGMLLATRVMDVPASRYIDPDHPVQVLMRSTLAEFAGVSTDEIPIAVDGCGVPAFFLSLYRAAFAYAQLAAPGPERYAESAARVVESMTSFPQYVGGSWTITTPLMAAFDGTLVAKEGAEGFYAMGITPALCGELTDRLRLPDDCAVGVAIKIADGSMERGRNPVVLRTLELLGIDVAARKGLERYREWPLRNVAGNLVGEVRAEFELEFL
ncbi:MAG TPA: asparaginase [Thermoanaerobaculia bacterium]|nr:asparaginase [Thermoanaerobaculia bacterium]